MGGWESAPVRSQRGANGSQGRGELTPVTVEQLAWRIVELLSDRIVDAVVDAVIHAPDLPKRRLVDAATIARQCGVERRFVYDHQRELGAIRLGHGPKARLRFDVRHVEAALAQRQEPARTRHGRPPRGRKPSGVHVDLLPIKGAM
jgi:hypothetical protein